MHNCKAILIHILLLLFLGSCNAQTSSDPENFPTTATQDFQTESTYTPFDTTFKVIHIFVALCDNKYQGIVPVPAKIGNGQDPNNNLYWGCGYGIRTYFKNSREWKLLKSQKIDSIRLERLVFKHATKKYYLVADAYNGKHIELCTKEFLSSSSGQLRDTLHINNTTIGIAGNSNLLAYIGHDGLMDFQLTDTFENTDKKKRDIIILACYSKRFFSPHLSKANVNPLVWTTGLMAPEAYTIHDAISGYVNSESNENIRSRAALAYSKFQKCSEKAARNLLVTGW
jgi:hypothetical protein